MKNFKNIFAHLSFNKFINELYKHNCKSFYCNAYQPNLQFNKFCISGAK